MALIRGRLRARLEVGEAGSWRSGFCSLKGYVQPFASAVSNAPDVIGFGVSPPVMPLVSRTEGSSEMMASPLQRSSTQSLGWLPLLAWFVLGLLTTLPGLWTRSLHYDEVYEARLAQLPIMSQYAPYAEPAALEIDWRSGLLLDSPHLYHTLLHPALALLGTNVFTIRLLAWLAGGLLVPLAFVLLTSLFPIPLAMLVTLGFNFSAWRVELAQMGRPHSLFLAFAMLGLVLFPGAAKRRSFTGWLAYCLTLAAAVQTSYWGILVVVPSHLMATLFRRKVLPYWRRAAAAQGIAGATSGYYILALLSSYGHHSTGDLGVARALAVPLFARCLVLFGAGEFSKLDLADLPLVGGITLVVLAVVIRGVLAWWRSGGDYSRWLGCCVGMWVALLFVAHFAAASLATSPMERKFALLVVPLLISFAFGIQSMRSSGWQYGTMGVWIAVAGLFALRSITSDSFRESAQVTAIVAAQARPLLVYSNRENWIEFLVGEKQTTSGISFRHVYSGDQAGFKWSTIWPDSREANVCLCLIREGNYLRGRLSALKHGSAPQDVDSKMKAAVVGVTERLTAMRWRPVALAYYPGRVSFRVACFAPAPHREATAMARVPPRDEGNGQGTVIVKQGPAGRPLP